MDSTELGAIAGAIAALAGILGLCGGWLKALARVRTLVAQVKTVIQAIEEVAGRDKISGEAARDAVKKHMTARGLEPDFHETVLDVRRESLPARIIRE